jgi:fucose permease
VKNELFLCIMGIGEIMEKRLALLMPLCFGIAFFLGVESGGFQLVLQKVAEEFALDPVMMGGVVSSQFSAIFIGPLLFGWISDRIGKKPVLLMSMVIFIAGCFGAAFSKTLVFFTFTVFILGMGFSVSECISTSLISDSFPSRESACLNIVQCGFSLGAVLSPLVFSNLIHAGLISWRAVFFSAGGGYALIYPLLVLFKELRPNSGNTDLPKAGNEPFTVKKTKLFSPFFCVLLFAMIVCVAIEAGLGYFADSLFVTEYGNIKYGAFAISGFWFSMAVSRLFFSRIKMKPQTMIMAGFLTVGLLLLFSLPFRNSLFMLIVFFLLGFALGPLWPMIVGIGASLNQKRSGTSVSILTAFGGLGGIAIPVLIGLVAERHGFYNSFWLLVFFSMAGYLIMRFGMKVTPQ